MVLKRDFNPPNKRERVVSHLKETKIDPASLVVTTIATTIAPTTLWEGIIRPSDLKVGRVFHIKGAGLITTHDANDMATITISLDGTTIITLQSPAGQVSDDAWHFKIFLTIRQTGAGGEISSHGDIYIVNETHNTMESFAADLSIQQPITLTCIWSDTDNSLKLTQCWIDEEA